MQTEVEEYPIVKVPIDKLIFDQTNPNKPTKEQIAAIKKSFHRFGYLVPIVVNESYQIGDGEHRALIYKELGIKEIPAYIVPRINDDIERRLLRQTMNKLRGEHEIKMDADEIALIFQSDKLDNLAELIATERESLENILTKHKGIQFQHEDGFDVDKALEDLVPETKLGDIWQLGQHRIICADCSDDRSIKRLMEDKKADMVFTDPPYNIMGASTGFTKMDDENVIRPFFKQMFRTIKSNIKMDGHCYICCNWRLFPVLWYENKSLLTPKNLIVWHKPNARLGGMYSNSHEFIFFLANDYEDKFITVNKGKVRTVYAETNVWVQSVNTNKEREHHAEKPLGLMVRAIGNSTEEGETCFDPFLGSGSTLIACEQTNRICFGCEIDPHYCDVVVKRWEAFTGNKGQKVQ